eukprot:CAMPEP_0117430934 /NCGR_PEP_ID=MMETSP0758-20121206/10494_1 /TAXON_ID=63605 /ORGANISM="Percolomonas cosmopolitus, Strain AE-1 (ATCC 50343)" /LENGTH=167 /DNA_ID=CAMNT_0005219491 /DNA_START=129 /DNA_END=630 /DNA_ORIENTATION=-
MKLLFELSHLSTPHVSVMSGPSPKTIQTTASSSSLSSTQSSSSSSSGENKYHAAKGQHRRRSHQHDYSEGEAAGGVSDDTQVLLDVLSQKLRGRRSASAARSRPSVPQKRYRKSPTRHHQHVESEKENVASPRTKWNNFFNAAPPPTQTQVPSANARIWEIQSTLDR